MLPLPLDLRSIRLKFEICELSELGEIICENGPRLTFSSFSANMCTCATCAWGWNTHSDRQQTGKMLVYQDSLFQNAVSYIVNASGRDGNL